MMSELLRAVLKTQELMGTIFFVTSIENRDIFGIDQPHPHQLLCGGVTYSKSVNAGGRGTDGILAFQLKMVFWKLHSCLFLIVVA